VDELKKIVLSEVTGLNQDWANIFKGADSEGISASDVTDMVAKLSERLQKIDLAFSDCRIRQKNSKKKGIFG